MSPPEQPAAAAGGNAGGSAPVNFDLSNLQLAPMLASLSQQITCLTEKVEGIPIPSKGKEARCDADFAWSKDGTKKNYSRHAKGAQLFEKMYHVLEAAKGQALPADSVTTLCGIVKEGLRLCYKAMLLTRVADSSSYEVAEEYLKLSDPDVYTIDIKKLEAAEKAVDRHSSKRVRFEKGRSYQSEYDEDVEESEDDAVESDEDV